MSVEGKVEAKISAGMDQKDERKRTAVEVSKFLNQRQFIFLGFKMDGLGRVRQIIKIAHHHIYSASIRVNSTSAETGRSLQLQDITFFLSIPDKNYMWVLLLHLTPSILPTESNLM